MCPSTRRRSFPVVASVYLFSFLCLAVPLVTAQAAEGVQGTWEGAMQLPSMELAVVVEFRVVDGTLEGDIDIPAQGAEDLPLGDISFEGSALRFKIQGVPGDPTFDGTLADDGGTISGTFSQGGQNFPFNLACQGSESATGAATDPDADPLDDYAAFVEQSREAWKAPGVAVAVVRDGKVVHAEGYGFRDVAAELPVTSDTLFAVGSTTKAFTATLVGMLVDEGKLDWDEPVRTYLPRFDMFDPFADDRISARDLLTHRSGLPRHDLSWYGAGASRDELVRRIAYLEPNRGFRDRFQYQNLMYMTAGYLAGRIEETTWEELIRQRILGPLEMKTTNLSIDAMEQAEDRALGYKKEENDDGEESIEVMPYRPIVGVAPAGSINSSVAEMANWVLLHLDGGVFNEKRLVSDATMNTMHSPQVVVPTDSLLHRLSVHPEMPHLMYGMGWFIQSYRGHELIHHGGNIDGFSALVSFMPDIDGAVVVLTNMNGTLLNQAIMLGTYDRLLGLDRIDWNARLQLVYATLEAAQEQQEEAVEERREGTQPSHALAAFAADYRNAGYGPLTVGLDEDGLNFHYNSFDGPLEHWHYDVFRVPEGDAEGTMLTFTTNSRGDVDEISIPFEATMDPIRFERLPPAELSDLEFLQTLVGEYDLGGAVCEVRLRGEAALTVTVPGQPTYALDPYRGTEFNLRGVSGYSVRFDVEGGEVTGLAFVQPNGVFEAVRKD
jgi:CubicO group peptidase (beta-lactamase class C family)